MSFIISLRTGFLLLRLFVRDTHSHVGPANSGIGDYGMKSRNAHELDSTGKAA